MQKKELYLVTGTIHSGKSSTLANWCQSRNDVYGILSPVENGKRFFLDISTGEKFSMESTPDEISTIPIGKFNFSMNAFSKAVEIITRSTYNKKGWLVIDEIGPLELSGRGFDEVLKEILQNSPSNMKIILVVRDTIKDDVIKRYFLEDHLIKEVNFLSGQDALV